MELSQYQYKAKETDAIDWSKNSNIEIVLLGMIGELGSVASVFKKRERDGNAYSGFNEDLEEELGDLLWYVVETANRLKIKISTGYSEAENSDVYKRIYKIQRNVNELVNHDEIRNFLSNGTCGTDNFIEERIRCVVNDINAIARCHDFDISSIADKNLKKTQSLFGGDISTPARQFDKECEPYEMMPRKFEIKFIETGKGKPIMQMNGMNLGARLTDNSYKDDGYKYHDVFHLANVATLGWSPVFRSMLNRKRKDNAETDEVEDGARAAIVEELIVNLIFRYAENNDFLEQSEDVDVGVVKQIISLAKDIEVSKAKAWEWKHCIVQGSRAFRKIQKATDRTLIIDSDQRSITLKQA